MKLSGEGDGEDMGGVGEGKNIIKIFFSEKNKLPKI